MGRELRFQDPGEASPLWAAARTSDELGDLKIGCSNRRFWDLA